MMVSRMLYISILIPVITWHQCQCGDDEKTAPIPPSKGTTMAEPSSTTLQSAQQNGHVVHASLSSGAVLDIAKLDSTIYQSFEYESDGNNVQLVVPQKGVGITKVVEGSTIIWEARKGERFQYAKLYLKNGQPELIFIVKSKNSATWKWYMRSDGEWVSCSNYVEKLNILKCPVDKKGDFTIHLENMESTDQCTTFNVDILGSPLRLYFPKSGYYATEVTHSGVMIWKAYESQICVSLNVYSEEGEPAFFLLKIRERNTLKLLYFEKNGREWVYINSDRFNKRLSRLRKVHPNSGYYLEDDVMMKRGGSRGPGEGTSITSRAWWSECFDAIKVTAPLSTAQRLLRNSSGGSGGYNIETPDDQDDAKTNQPVQGMKWRSMNE